MTVEVQKKYEVYEDERETSQDMKQDSKQDMGCGDGNCQDGSSVEIVLENFTINVFFDGTGNNAHNTEFRLLDEEYLTIYQEYKEKLKVPSIGTFDNPSSIEELHEYIKYIEIKEERDQDIQDLKDEMDRYLEEKEYANKTYLQHEVSYRNEFSNVALLHLASDEKQNKGVNLYIEGAGTTKDILDDQDGLGFAKGNSGVFSRMNEAFEEIARLIKQNMFDRYTINVFGFSRGAFYARMFCAALKDFSDDVGFTFEKPFASHPQQMMSTTPLQQGKLDQNRRYSFLKRSPDDFTINLVGIFDTVSSHGWEHYNDTGSRSAGKFPIDITPDKQDIINLVHFTAQNEYREHFPLTPITSALNENSKCGKSIELSFPGAHSNIGGAYNDIWIERNHYISLVDKASADLQRAHDGEIHYRWWKDKGYYTDDELVKSDDGTHSTLDYSVPDIMGNPSIKTTDRKVYYANRAVRNHYQYVILTAMKFVSEKYAHIIFDEQVERYKDRLQIFEDAKKGQDVEKLFTDNKGNEKEKVFLEKLKRNKSINSDNGRANLLKNIDNKIQTFVKRNIDKKGHIAFKLEDEIPELKDRLLLYGTFICNSLNPINRYPEWDGSKDLVGAPTYPSNDKYDIQPQKETRHKSSIIPSFPGIENEGLTAKNHDEDGRVIRPTVAGG